MRIWIAFFIAVPVLAISLWSNDWITMQGERTIYTAECRDGVWQGRHCTGHLAAGSRFRFRALKPHGEVIFWTVGSSEPSGKFTDCQIVDGRNWSCKPAAMPPVPATFEIARGLPVADRTGRARSFHALSKWRWWMLDAGLPAGSDADN
jgi:hypothetical protein